MTKSDHTVELSAVTFANLPGPLHELIRNYQVDQQVFRQSFNRPYSKRFTVRAVKSYRSAIATVKSIVTVPSTRARSWASVLNCSSFMSITMPGILIDPRYPLRLKPHWTMLLVDIRRKIMLYSFAYKTAVVTVRSLHLALLNSGNRSAFNAVIAMLPQLELNFLLDDGLVANRYTNLAEWIDQIEDADDRDDVRNWAAKAADGSWSAAKFDERVKAKIDGWKGRPSDCH